MCEIKICISEEAELYNSFDESGKTLSSDFIDYVSNALENRTVGERLAFRISSPDNIDETRLKNALSEYCESQGIVLKKQKSAKRINELRLLSIGVLFVVLGITFGTKINEVAATIISTIGSFSIWEAANIWLQELPKLKMEERKIKFLQNYQLTIIKTS